MIYFNTEWLWKTFHRIPMESATKVLVDVQIQNQVFMIITLYPPSCMHNGRWLRSNFSHSWEVFPEEDSCALLISKQLLFPWHLRKNRRSQKLNLTMNTTLAFMLLGKEDHKQELPCKMSSSFGFYTICVCFHRVKNVFGKYGWFCFITQYCSILFLTIQIQRGMHLQAHWYAAGHCNNVIRQKGEEKFSCCVSSERISISRCSLL